MPERVEFAERVPTERWFGAWFARLDAADGRSPFIALILDDLSEQRRTDRIRVDFVANASHELRTPLASLVGFIETLQGPAREDPVARERFLKIMHDQTARMSRLVNDLLSLSRIEMKAHLRPAGEADLVAIIQNLEDALEPLARDLGVAIETALPEEPVLVTGDRDELIQVFENLIENACKYGQSGKRVVVTVTPGREGVGATVSVRDFGPGIAEEHLPRLTERFYRVDVEASRQHRGTGLGLAIVKHILARHQPDFRSKAGLARALILLSFFRRPQAQDTPESAYHINIIVCHEIVVLSSRDHHGGSLGSPRKRGGRRSSLARYVPRSPKQQAANIIGEAEVKYINLAVATGIAVALTVSVASAADLTGAGATFPAPIYAKWAEAYKAKTGVGLNYQSIGSGGGIKQIEAKTVDFGASDKPLDTKELDKFGLMQFPTVMGGIVPVVNIQGVKPGDIILDGPTLANIFQGKITKWDDPAIAKLNGKVKLPSAAIAVVHRSDGSGTTFNFTYYLAQVSSDWKDNVGVNTSVEWPVGIGAKGNEGVSATVQQTANSIGYVEYFYAVQTKLTYTGMVNKDGKTVQPTRPALPTPPPTPTGRERPATA